MGLLKHEMRAIFEKNLNLSILGPQAIFDDGLLRQIAYLSFLNPNVFPNLDWRVLCIKSSASKRKLYSCCSIDGNFEDCGAALLFFCDSIEQEAKKEYYINLLKISLMFACRINQIDFEVVKITDSQALIEYFNLPEKTNIQVIIALGLYEKSKAVYRKTFLNYEDAVREI